MKIDAETETLQPILVSIVDEVKARAPKIYEEAVVAAERAAKPKPRKADFDKFGIAVFTSDGKLYQAGNAETVFPIQSISKVFALEVAIEGLGEKLWTKGRPRTLGRCLQFHHRSRAESGYPLQSIHQRWCAGRGRCTSGHR